MPRQSQSSWFDRQYHIWWGVQIIKLLSLHSCHTVSEAFEWIFNWNYAKLSKTWRLVIWTFALLKWRNCTK
jgi:hypothetical protein